MSARRASVSRRAARTLRGGRHRAVASARAVAIGTTGVAATAVLSLGLGFAGPLAAAAASPAAVAPAHVVHASRAIPSAVVSSLGVRAVQLAATRAGDPYVYGGDGPHSFDCSGLVQWVYRHLDTDLPRTAGAQYSATRHIPHSQARVGDLIFFAHGGRIYHVAIYAGHGWIWAAPYPGRAVEKEKLWTSNYLVGRVR